MTEILNPEAEASLPVLPLRDVVVFPHMVIPLFVGRKKSIKALEVSMEAGKQILLVAQKNAADDDPGVDEIYQVGTVASILQLLKLPDGTVKVLVEGENRVAIDRYVESEDYFSTLVNPISGWRHRRAGNRGADAHRSERIRPICKAQ